MSIDYILNIISHIVSLITTSPVSYLFFTIFVIWVFHLFFEVVKR